LSPLLLLASDVAAKEQAPHNWLVIVKRNTHNLMKMFSEKNTRKTRKKSHLSKHIPQQFH